MIETNQLWGKLSIQQQEKLLALSSLTSHPVEVSGVDSAGVLLVHLHFPGLWLTIDRGGRVILTQSELQHSQSLTTTYPFDKKDKNI